MSTKSIRPFSFPLRFPSHSFSSLFSIFLSASWLFFLTYSPLPVVCIFTTYQIKALGILQASLKHHLQQCFKKQCQESLWCGRRLHWFPYKVLVQNVWAHSTTQPKTGRTETHTHTHTPTTSEDRNTPPPPRPQPERADPGPLPERGYSGRQCRGGRRNSPGFQGSRDTAGPLLRAGEALTCFALP